MAIGKAIRRIEDPRFLVGEGRYVADIHVPGMREACIVRSPYAHARIQAIDRRSLQQKHNGVVLFTARELPPDLSPIPMRLTPTPALERALQMPLASEVVRYVGEPVAVIVAQSRYAAEDAASDLVIDYEPLPVVADITRALQPGAPLMYPAFGSNTVHTLVAQKGHVDEVLRQAPQRLDLEFGVQRHAAVPLETRGLLAVPESEGRLLVYGPTKVVHYNHEVLARLLRCDPALIRFIETDVGGGFGARGEFYPEDFLIPFISWQLGCPLRWIEDRLEHLQATNHSREQCHRLTVGFDNDGKLLALKDEIWVDTGAYIRTHGVTVPDMTQAMLPGPYVWPAFRLLTHVVVTNKTPLGTYRAPGRYEGTFVRERMIEAIAHSLRLDPTLVRERNFIPPQDMPYTVGTQGLGENIVLDSGDYPRLLTLARQQIQWETFPQRKAQAHAQGCLRGLGWAVFVEKTGLGPWEEARIVLDETGSFICYSGLAALGQGTETMLAQLCSHCLGVAAEQITIVHGDTDLVPSGGGSFASRGAAVGGVAAYLAAEELKQRLFAVAEEYFEVSPLDIRSGPAGLFLADSPAHALSWQQLATQAKRSGVALDVVKRFPVSRMTYPYGIHVAEVEIDKGTGGIQIIRYLIVYDVGRAINPLIVKGQLTGGMAQGLGGALLEELAYNEEGQLISGTFMDYLLPGSCEVPEVEVIITEDAPSRLNPLGIKGCGEGGTTGVGAAIANAVADALDAPPEAFTQLPIRPQTVLAWLRKMSISSNASVQRPEERKVSL